MNVMKAASFGEFMRVHRLGEGTSQVEFAKQLGISKQRLCDIEHNRFAVSIKLAKEIALKLDFPAEWLVKLALQDQIKKEKLRLKVS
jgi:DNA-binding XRE family transcriptional regulator